MILNLTSHRIPVPKAIGYKYNAVPYRRIGVDETQQPNILWIQTSYGIHNTIVRMLSWRVRPGLRRFTTFVISVDPATVSLPKITASLRVVILPTRNSVSTNHG